MSDTAANKRLAVRWLELVSAGDVTEICRMTSPQWTMEGGPPQGSCKVVRRAPELGA